MSQKTTLPFTPGQQTYRGSCHCGAVRFEVETDLEEGTTQCNCTSCSKSGWWGMVVRPEAFRIVSGAERRETPAPYVFHKARCPTCSILVFSHGNMEELGGEYYSVNVRCLDGISLAGVPIRYHDGLHDTWAQLAQGRYVDPFIPSAA